MNSEKVLKSARTVGAGDVLTFAQGNDIRVIEIIQCGTRRGPAPEAQTLYHDKTPAKDDVARVVSPWGKGRPTKKDRRSLDLSRRPPLD